MRSFRRWGESESLQHRTEPFESRMERKSSDDHSWTKFLVGSGNFRGLFPHSYPSLLEIFCESFLSQFSRTKLSSSYPKSHANIRGLAENIADRGLQLLDALQRLRAVDVRAVEADC